jgi:hypothetical protein
MQNADKLVLIDEKSSHTCLASSLVGVITSIYKNVTYYINLNFKQEVNLFHALF